MLLAELENHWKKLGDTPIDEDERIDDSLTLETSKGIIVFEKGTFREDIWDWFESQNENFMIAVAMGIAKGEHRKIYDQVKMNESNKIKEKI